MLGLIADAGPVGQGFSCGVKHVQAPDNLTPTLGRMGVIVMKRLRADKPGRFMSVASRVPMASVSPIIVVSHVPAGTNVQALPW